MKLLRTPVESISRRSTDEMQRYAFRTRDLFAGILKQAIDKPTIDGRPVVVTLKHWQANGKLRVSHSPEDAFESYQEHLNSSRAIGRRIMQVDMPIPAQRDLPTSATRLRAVLHAPSGQQHSYGYDLTAYKPPDDGKDFTPPDRLHFERDNIRNIFLIRRHMRADSAEVEIRTVTQQQTAAEFDMGRVQTFITDVDGLQAAYDKDQLPIFTNQEKQILDLGAYTLARCQLGQDLSVMTALVGENPAVPLGIY